MSEPSRKWRPSRHRIQTLPEDTEDLWSFEFWWMNGTEPAKALSMESLMKRGITYLELQELRLPEEKKRFALALFDMEIRIKGSPAQVLELEMHLSMIHGDKSSGGT